MKKLSPGTLLRRYIHRLNTGGVPVPRTRYRNTHETTEPTARIRHGKVWLNILLFVATFITTTLSQFNPELTASVNIIESLPYSCTLMCILAVHEFGHYFAAKSFGVDATLPYFIPFPSLVGTLGAVIKTRSPIRGRRALFYIGIMGPLPGFIVSLAAVIAGIHMSQVRPIMPYETGMIVSFGDSILFALIVRLMHGTIAHGSDIFLHPVAFAGWLGFLLTSLNLIPVGQLDGGHILYALTGKKQRYAGWTALAVLACLSFFWPGWIVWLLIILLVTMVGHPPVSGGDEKLSATERAAGWLCMVILAVTFIPVPVKII